MRMVIEVCNELEKNIKRKDIVRCYRIGKRSPRHMIVRLKREEVVKVSFNLEVP